MYLSTTLSRIRKRKPSVVGVPPVIWKEPCAYWRWPLHPLRHQDRRARMVARQSKLRRKSSQLKQHPQHQPTSTQKSSRYHSLSAVVTDPVFSNSDADLCVKENPFV